MTDSDVSTSAADRLFPALHPRPGRGWVNDPNGLAHIDGRWHVFFQWNPRAAHSERIHWGHLSSPDLLTWTNHPAALQPRDGRPDSFGCWTGCVVDDGGTPTAVYSGVVDGSGHSEVLLARSDRQLVDWQQQDRSVLPMPDPDRFSDSRDPFVLHHGGHRWAVLGGGHRDGDPAVLVYRVDDLTDWQPAGTLVDTSDPIAASVAGCNIWECPNLVPVDGRWVLILSLMGSNETVSNGVGASTGINAHENRVRYLVGDLEVTDDLQLRFRPQRGGLLDSGPAFYAPQAVVAGDRTMLWGWSWELREQAAADAAGWAGSLTLPRELALRDGQLVSRPAAELSALIGPALGVADRLITDHAFLIRFAGPGSLAVDGEPVLELDGPAEVWVDGSVVEAYPVSGTPFTTRGYPQAGWTVTGPADLFVLGEERTG
ncbi:glycoside hydrolase family 32 protein [Microlunatus soli]|uniref:beta-fructofuranosidase n=1 Tax=Microlunatus soli TaxID=630515 RepID=A0A1H1URN2_9ACTN|nr:glycoside hydrolase family 32 protein [Microlunatus soli]SDS75182.1 beta-fructofuranosidase [Microlunatus soli]